MFKPLNLLFEIISVILGLVIIVAVLSSVGIFLLFLVLQVLSWITQLINLIKDGDIRAIGGTLVALLVILWIVLWNLKGSRPDLFKKSKKR
jgi:hypothetical protein